MRGYDIDKYINKKFGNLTLIENLHKIDKNNSKLAIFKCDCGNIKELVFTQVLAGDVKSCGCNQGKLSKKAKQKQRKNILEFNKNKTSKVNKTGKTGISKSNGKYRVRIQINGKGIHLGYFDNIDDAIAARKVAEEKYFKPILDKYEGNN